MESSLVHVDINLRYEVIRPLVNFKNITLPSEVGRVIAREKWTREFFRNLKEISKTHLEQAGKITGECDLGRFSLWGKRLGLLQVLRARRYSSRWYPVRRWQK
jgi:hypothetical protein